MLDDISQIVKCLEAIPLPGTNAAYYPLLHHKNVALAQVILELKLPLK